MAFIEMSYMSNALQRTVPLRIVTPADKVLEGGYAFKPGAKFKLLVLLHGYHGSYVDWTNATRIQKWAETNEFMVVMPSGDNQMYVDSIIPGNDYGKMIGEEIPTFMRTAFPVSDRREDTFLAGLSMGGFGTLRNGLKYNEVFSHLVVLSGGVKFFFDLDDVDKNDVGYKRFDKLLGGMEAAKNSDNNPLWCAKDLMERHKADPSVPIPRIYMSGGTEDSIYEGSVMTRDYLRELGYDVTWDEGPGEHAWTYWDPQLQKVIAEFLPLQEGKEGLDSGHIRL